MMSTFVQPTLQKVKRYLLLTLPLIIALVLISFYWIDRPLAEWAHSLLSRPDASALSGHLAIVLTQTVYNLFIPVFIVYFVLKLQGKTNRLTHCLGLLSTSVTVSFFIKNALQFLFGRIVPRYGGHSTLLFMRNPKLYGFAWFQAGSLPSGHMTLCCCSLLAIWLYYRNTWITTLFLLLALTLAALLLLLNYHFFSDVIAGSYLGISITLALYLLQKSESSSIL